MSGAVPWTDRPNPSYFLIASGAQSFPVHVWPFSHILSTGNDEVRLKAVSRAAHSLRVDVSAYSVFIGRGDLFHAGASGSETNTTSNPTNVRLISMRRALGPGFWTQSICRNIAISDSMNDEVG